MKTIASFTVNHDLLEKGMYNLAGSDTHSMGFVNYYLNGKLSRKVVQELENLLSLQL